MKITWALTKEEVRHNARKGLGALAGCPGPWIGWFAWPDQQVHANTAKQGEGEEDETINNGDQSSHLGRGFLVGLLLKEESRRKNQLPSPTNLRNKTCFYLITDHQLSGCVVDSKVT